jgi:hypothetical protein
LAKPAFKKQLLEEALSHVESEFGMQADVVPDSS